MIDELRVENNALHKKVIEYEGTDQKKGSELNEYRRNMVGCENVIRDLRERNTELQRRLNLMQTEIEKLSYDSKNGEVWQMEMLSFHQSVGELRKLNEEYRAKAITLQNQVDEMHGKYA